MEQREMGNQTSIAKFILLGFGNLPELHIPLFLLFLAICLVTVAGNILIIVLVVADQHLHTPMYFFLANLSCLETFCTLTILPKMLASFLTEVGAISVGGCITQFYCFALLATTECYPLASMSYDQYLAICKPLHYAALMNGRLCLQLAGASWMSGFLVSTILLLLISQLKFCGPSEIDHFFCDFTPLINLSCSDTSLVTWTTFAFAYIDIPPPFVITVASYSCIISTVLRIPSSKGRQKAFSTCSSHLMVVTLFYGTLIIVYVIPKSSALRNLNKVFSVFYSVLTPLVNPLIYSLRNREVRKALRKVVSKFVRFNRTEMGSVK
ncbi:olfactory receptor 11A1-like [Alligator mississippiensis]|uniref:olfactory receptor 11A1-like n=1 Tax=Alligator mississippiensis TaxID=8496 RepID=UPI0003D07AA8|nr:olfactory receptor 11A1-like [Alligator mississippiensis]